MNAKKCIQAKQLKLINTATVYLDPQPPHNMSLYWKIKIGKAFNLVQVDLIILIWRHISMLLVLSAVTVINFIPFFSPGELSY